LTSIELNNIIKQSIEYKNKDQVSIAIEQIKTRDIAQLLII